MAKPTFVVMLQEDEYKTNVVISGDALLIPMNNLRSLKEGFRLIASKAPVTCLFIVAHGLEGRVEVGSSTQHASGLGIGLGFEGIFNSNVGMWAQIRGKVQNIVVYACNAATTDSPMMRGSIADGKYMMGQLAIFTGANVYAADRLQAADIGDNVDFGPWEGQVFEFSPTGLGSPRPVDKPPYELKDV